MRQKPYFSVIIPTLNEEKYLPRILKSLSVQTYKDYEVIIVDGGSKDKTKIVFNKIEKLLPSPKFLESSKANVGYQRNLGAKNAMGYFLIFLDADVDIDPTFLEEVHIAAIKCKFKLATTWIKPDSEKSVDRMIISVGNLLTELTKEMNRPFSGGYNTIVRKDIFLSLSGFREDLIINEDHDFTIRAFKKGIDCEILKEPKVTYSLRRMRSENFINLMRKYAQCQIYNMFKGPITKEIIKYPMGGHVHNEKRKTKINLIKLNTYLKSISKLENKIVDLLGE